MQPYSARFHPFGNLFPFPFFFFLFFSFSISNFLFIVGLSFSKFSPQCNISQDVEKVYQMDENLQKCCTMGEKFWTKDDKLRAYSSIMCNLQNIL